MDKLRATLHYIIHILLAVIIILLILVRPAPSNTRTIVEKEGKTDTLWRDTTIYRTIKIPKPYPVEVAVVDTITKDSIIYIDTTKHVANVYEDSTKIKSGTIYWSALVSGRLLDLNASYRGKMPHAVIEYRDRTVLVPQRGLFFRSSIGYNGDEVSADVGVEFLTRKGRAIGYEYDYVQKYHKITSAIKVF